MALDERKVDRFVDGEWIGDTANQGLTRCAVDQTRRKVCFTAEIDALGVERTVSQDAVKHGRGAFVASEMAKSGSILWTCSGQVLRNKGLRGGVCGFEVGFVGLAGNERLPHRYEIEIIVLPTGIQ